jgi:small subunit ribosomal protein S16
MAVKIRLSRVGATKQPAYRVVVMDIRSARDSKAIETLGHYNPRTNPVEFAVDVEKTRKWLAQGALPSDTVARLLANAGLIAKPAARPAGTPKVKAAK